MRRSRWEGEPADLRRLFAIRERSNPEYRSAPIRSFHMAEARKVRGRASRLAWALSILGAGQSRHRTFSSSRLSPERRAAQIAPGRGSPRNCSNLKACPRHWTPLAARGFTSRHQNHGISRFTRRSSRPNSGDFAPSPAAGLDLNFQEVVHSVPTGNAAAALGGHGPRLG